jgi:hypothetical protein
METRSTFDAQEIIHNLWLGSEEAAFAPIEMLNERGISSVLTVGFGISQIHPIDVG